jgi:hypothetical protein
MRLHKLKELGRRAECQRLPMLVFRSVIVVRRLNMLCDDPERESEHELPNVAVPSENRYRQNCRSSGNAKILACQLPCTLNGPRSALVAGFPCCRMGGMNTHHKNSLVATLARIDKQIVESDALLLKLPTGGELLQIKDELTYLRIERRGIAAKLRRNP